MPRGRQAIDELIEAHVWLRRRAEKKTKKVTQKQPHRQKVDSANASK
jgi:hypothetical protein